MDPGDFMQHDVTIFSLSCFLGLVRTPEERKQASEQGMKLLRRYGVIPDRNTEAMCPTCNERLQTVTDSLRYGWRYLCKNHQPHVKTSPLQNTFLSNVRLNGEFGADRAVKLIYMWLHHLPLNYVQLELHLAKDTAVHWYGFCRDVACSIAWHDYVPIGGNMDVVEVDETHLFKRKYNVGRLTKWYHVWVVGGISRTTKKRFALIVEKRDADTLLPILQQCIDNDSYICSDYWLAYNDCRMVFNGGHGRVNHSQNFINPPKGEPPLWMPAGRFNQECLDLTWGQAPPVQGQQPFRISTQNIERAWRGLKTHLRSTNNMEYASQYIGEWMYRTNILDRIGDTKSKLEKFLQDIHRVYPGVGKKPMKLRYEDILDCDCHECQP